MMAVLPILMITIENKERYNGLSDKAKKHIDFWPDLTNLEENWCLKLGQHDIIYQE